MPKHIKAKVQGILFNKVARLDELHEMGDPLARLDTVVDWTVFAPILRPTRKGREADRPSNRG